MRDALGQILGKGGTTALVMNDLRLFIGLGEAAHGGDEVWAIAKYPRGAHHIMLRRGLRGGFASGLRRPVGGKGRGNLVFGVQLLGSIEDVVAGYVHEGQLVFGSDAGELGRRFGVDGPGGGAIVFRTIDVVVGGAVDDGLVLLPLALRGIGDVELRMGAELGILENPLQRTAELAIRTGNEDFAGWHGGYICKRRQLLVFF